MPAADHNTNRTTAFVLAGGGSFGAIQAGMLRALAANGIGADMVVGSSVGAINGAYFAGAPTEAGVAKLERLWLGLRRQDVFPITLRTLAGFLRRRDFLVAPHGLRSLIEANLPYRNLEDAVIPVHVVATNVLSGKTAVFSKGPAVDAIAASTAIPAAFAPVEVDMQFCCDGAVASNTPVKVAVARGADRLIILSTGFACGLEKPPRGAIANALHALTLLVAGQLVSELESLANGVEYHIVPTICPLAGSPYDFSQTRHLIEQAAANTERWLSAGGLEQQGIPDAFRLHSHASV